MRTFRFPSTSDREHRFIFFPPPPEAPLPAPAAEKPADAPAAPVENADETRQRGSDAAAQAEAELWKNAERITNLRATLLPGGNYSSGHGLKWDQLNTRDLEVARNILVSELKPMLRAINASARHGSNRLYVVRNDNAPAVGAIENDLTNINKTMIERTNAANKGITVQELRRQETARQQQAEAQRTARNAPAAAAANGAAPAQEGGRSGPDGRPPQTPEQRLSAAEQALLNPASPDELAGAILDVRESTKNQLVAMDDPKNSDPQRNTVDQAGRKQQERLIKEVRDAPAGTTIDTLIQQKKNDFDTGGEKATLEGRSRDAKAARNLEAERLGILQTNLGDAKSAGKPAPDIATIEEDIRKATEKKTEFDHQVGDLAAKLKEATGKLDSDVAMLESMKRETEVIVTRSNDQINSIGSALRGNANPNLRALGNEIPNYSVIQKKGVEIYLSIGGAANQDLLKRGTADDKALNSAARFLKALDATLKRANAPAA